MIATFSDWIFHLDVHLALLAAQHGAWIYAVLFLVIFVETGVVVMPFLPGDSLLFVSGALAAAGVLSLPELMAVLAIAAIIGDATNYVVGTYVRRHAVDTRRIPLLKPEHLERTHIFFVRHGRKTIILARFVPIVRTLAPFVAALGAMPYRVFTLYNVVGALIWVISVAGAGYLFGNIPWIKSNLTAVILGIVLLSVLPGVFGWLAERRNTAG
jgi:membrane-associated protein